jgi:nucleotide-binding universal stress UspA family protein
VNVASDPSSIVVGVDGSPSTRCVLRWAADEARSRSVALVAVHVWAPNRSGAGTRRTARNAWALLDRVLADSVGDLVGVAIRRVVERGDPTAVLLAEAAKGATLVIGSSHTPENVASVRSVAWRCVRRAVGPVVLVPDESVACRNSGLSEFVGLANVHPNRASLVPQRARPDSCHGMDEAYECARAAPSGDRRER